MGTAQKTIERFSARSKKRRYGKNYEGEKGILVYKVKGIVRSAERGGTSSSIPGRRRRRGGVDKGRRGGKE